MFSDLVEQFLFIRYMFYLVICVKYIFITQMDSSCSGCKLFKLPTSYQLTEKCELITTKKKEEEKVAPCQRWKADDISNQKGGRQYRPKGGERRCHHAKDGGEKVAPPNRERITNQRRRQHHPRLRGEGNAAPPSGRREECSPHPKGRGEGEGSTKQGHLP